MQFSAWLAHACTVSAGCLHCLLSPMLFLLGGRFFDESGERTLSPLCGFCSHLLSGPRRSPEGAGPSLCCLRCLSADQRSPQFAEQFLICNETESDLSACARDKIRALPGSGGEPEGFRFDSGSKLLHSAHPCCVSRESHCVIPLAHLFAAISFGRHEHAA